MESYALVYRCSFTIRLDQVTTGSGLQPTTEFVAGVRMLGRAVMEFSEDEWWMSGVGPGGIAASAATPMDAHREFQREFQEISRVFAEESEGDIDRFEAAMNQFVNDEDGVALGVWKAAIDRIRRTGSIEAPFDTLERVSIAGLNFGVEVHDITGLFFESLETQLAA